MSERTKIWLLGGVAVLVSLVALLFSDRCYLQEHLSLITAVALGWFVAFLFASNRTRIGLLAVAIAAALATASLRPQPCFTPSVEAGAVRSMQRAAALLRQYKLEHPSESYPATIPPIAPDCRVRGLYEFTYQQERSNGAVAAVSFLISAVPIAQSVSRGLRSFTLTEDGHLYATVERRRANRHDEALE
jgi:hypothetical protein